MAQRPRLGAYVLAADPTWIRSTIARYYDNLDVLVVSASASRTGWTGAPIDSEECVAAVEELDRRKIVRVVRGEWINTSNPMAAETAQRQAALAAVGSDVDWILQFDTDELLPDVEALYDVLEAASCQRLDAVEWPMRVLYRRLPDGRYLEVVARSGAPRFDYPGPIAVRPWVRLRDGRRTNGPFLRPAVEGDTESLQIVRAPEHGECRGPKIAYEAAVLHNSWARSPRVVWRKVRSWGHGGTWRALAYYFLVWLPAPATWRWLRAFHPFGGEVWPRLARVDLAASLDPRDEC